MSKWDELTTAATTVDDVFANREHLEGREVTVKGFLLGGNGVVTSEEPLVVTFNSIVVQSLENVWDMYPLIEDNYNPERFIFVGDQSFYSKLIAAFSDGFSWSGMYTYANPIMITGVLTSSKDVEIPLEIHDISKCVVLSQLTEQEARTVEF